MYHTYYLFVQTVEAQRRMRPELEQTLAELVTYPRLPPAHMVHDFNNYRIDRINFLAKERFCVSRSHEVLYTDLVLFLHPPRKSSE